MVTLCGGRGFSPILRCLLLGFGWTVITPLAGKTTNWRAGCGRSASPVRREGDSNSIGSPYPYQRGILYTFLRGGLDGLDDPLMGSAAAQVAVHLLDNLAP